MDKRIELLSDDLQNLKCNKCAEFLSVPPVHFIEHQYICGRCKPEVTVNQLKAFEELAKYMLFPCIYKNCDKKIHWNDVKEHEECCMYKTIICPFPKCQKKCKLTGILEHCKSVHGNASRKKSVFAKIRITEDSSSCKEMFLLTVKETTYLVFVFGKKGQKNTYKYHCGVYSVDKNFSSDVRYILRIYGGANKIIRTSQKVKVFNEKIHCLHCFEGDCSVKYHQPSQSSLTTKLTFSITEPDLVISYKIAFEEKSANSVSKSQSLQNLVPNSYSTISSKLECPICNNYMCAPIYLCSNGHTFCKDCKNKMLFCPYCKAEVGNSRNFVLEEIAETAELVCQNADRGCFFIGVIAAIKNHENTCAFKKQ